MEEHTDFTATVTIVGRLGRDVTELVRTATILALRENRRVEMTANGRMYAIDPDEILARLLNLASEVPAPK